VRRDVRHDRLGRLEQRVRRQADGVPVVPSGADDLLVRQDEWVDHFARADQAPSGGFAPTSNSANAASISSSVA
jgi:hypothetical protein